MGKWETLLGDEAESLLGHKCKTIPKAQLHLPGPDYVDRVVAAKNRSPRVMRNLQAILPVDQGVEHSGGASFAPKPV